MTTFLIALLLISLACNTLTGSSPTDPDDEKLTGSSPTDPDDEKWITEVEKDYGPGSFSLSDTKAGLAVIYPGIQPASPSLSMGPGTGTPRIGPRCTRCSPQNSPLARQWTIEKSNSISHSLNRCSWPRWPVGLRTPRRTSLHRGRDAGRELVRDRFELAELLHFVIGAEPAGNETVNDIAADHYTFDERALDEEGLTDSTANVGWH